MSIHQYSREFIPRIIGVMIVAMCAWMAMNMLGQKNIDRWADSLKHITEDAGEMANDWLLDKLELSAILADDTRVLSVFYDPEDLQPVRSALYEFGKVNNIDNVYVFDIDVVSVVAKKAGSPTLPSESIDFLAAAHDEGWTRIAHFITAEDGETSIAFASVIRGDLGEVIGYVIYTEPLKKALQGLKNPLGRVTPVKLALYRLASANHTSMIAHYNSLTPKFIDINPLSVSFPVFSHEEVVGEFKDLDNQTPVMMSIQDVPEQQRWLISASIPRSLIKEEGSSANKMIKIAAAVLALMLLLVPGKGRYSQALKNIYKKMFPELSPKDKKKLNIPVINIGDTPSTTEESKKKYLQSRGEIPTDGGAAPKQGSNRSVGFVGEGRKEGFGTNAEDLKPVEKRVRKPRVKKEGETSDAAKAFMIRQGIKNERFKLMYQPIIDVKTGKPVMYETLCRILDEADEIIPPPEWLPVVREGNLFGDIDRGVINQATQQHILCEEPLGTPLTFNISGNTFDSFSFMESLMEKMVDRPDLASLMLFELSSKEIIQDKKALKFIKECRDLGFKFSIDYFGGGTQTLKAAKTLKFDYIKLDALKFDINDKADQKELITLIKTAEALEMPMIIERIEDAVFYNFVTKVGAPYAQGYYLAEPAEEASGDLIT